MNPNEKPRFVACVKCGCMRPPIALDSAGVCREWRWCKALKLSGLLN